MKYAKFIVAALIAGATTLQAAVTDDAVTSQEWIAIALAALAAVGVYFVPNKPAVE